jgi:hypothetical protein
MPRKPPDRWLGGYFAPSPLSIVRVAKLAMLAAQVAEKNLSL